MRTRRHHQKCDRMNDAIVNLSRRETREKARQMVPRTEDMEMEADESAIYIP